MSELETETAVDPGAETAELVLAEPDADELPGELEVRGADADLLALPPRVDDLGTALAARPPRLKLPKITTALVAAALLCGGFLGGVLVEKHSAGSSSRGGANFAAFGTGTGGTGTGAAGRTGRGGFGGLGGTGSGPGTGSSAVSGTVTVVTGNTLYVTAADGSVYTVTTNGSTAVSIAQSGSLSQLKPGQTVVIAGSNDGKGDVTATSITAGSTTNNTTSTGQ
jgi:hypothetical protein